MRNAEGNRTKLRRSVLFMPSTNQRATRKAAQLPADVIILDMEDSVPMSAKSRAREAMLLACSQNNYSGQEVLTRINAMDSTEWRADVAAAMTTDIDGIVVPKVESPKQVLELLQTTLDSDAKPKPLWLMLETPLGIANAREIAACDQSITALIVGTADLNKSLCLPDRADRLGSLYSLSQVVLAARCAGLSVIDGVFMDVRDAQGLSVECKQGRALGFDGKSLIHPNQLALANEFFAPTEQELAVAKRVVEAWENNRDVDSGVCIVDDKLVEFLHVEQAQVTLAKADAIRLKTT